MINTHTGSRFAAVLLAVLVFAAAQAAEPSGDVLRNADIINMTRANTSPMVIVNRIYSASNNFDLSDQAFLQLKESGVADEVLNAMLAAAKAGNAAAAVNNASSSLPALGSSGSSLAPPSLSLPPLGGADMSLTPPSLPGQQSSPSPSFSDMPGFGDLPAFGEMPGASTPPPLAAPGGGFSAPAAATPPTGSPVAPQQALTTPPASQPAFSPPAASVTPVSPSAPSPARPQPSSPPPAAVSVRPSSPTPSSPAPVPQAAQAGGLDVQRFERELIAIVQGAPDTQRTGLAWMLANQEQTLPILRRALDVPNPEFQAAALRVLGSMNDKNSIPKMRDSLGNPSPLVRQHAAQALAEMNDLVAIGAAEQNLGSDINPRDGLIRLVGYARLVRASEALGSVLANDETALNRAAAAWALSEIGPAGAVAWPALEKALLGDADVMVRREAAAAVAAFHVAGSAKLLQSACRRDPEVRKITLAAMADYPETVEFLVGVMNLGTGQIAPDELETAARSLAKLTGQNFFLDGSRWQAWFDENKSRFAQTTQNLASVLTNAPSPGRTDMGTGMPPRRDDEISRMGIVVDPNEIPMAPEVDDRYARRGGGIGGGGGPVRAPNIDNLIEYDPNAPLPDALSVTDFEGNIPPAAPAAAADVGVPASPFGTSAADGAQAQAPGTPFSSQWGEGISVDLPSASGLVGGGGGEQAWGGPSTASTPSAMPTQSVVGAPAGGMTSSFGGGADSGAGAGGGLRLALPPIGDESLGGDGGMPSTMLGTVAAGSPIAAPVDGGSSDSGGLSAGESMLFDSSPSVSTFSADVPGQAAMLEQSYSAPDSYSAGIAAPMPPMGSMNNDSIPMDAILHDGFTGEVIVPKAGVDVMATTSGGTFEPAGAMQPVPEAMPVPDAMHIPETADAAEPVETLSFPGDTSTFGLGDPLFTESGPNAGYEFEAAAPSDISMPALPGGDASVPAPSDPLAAGLLGAMDEADGTGALVEGDAGESGYVDSGESFEPYEDGSANIPPPGEVYTLPAETAPQGGEIETYADDSDSLESMEWVRGVGFVKRATPVAKPAASAPDTSSYYVEPPVIQQETEAAQPSTSGWSDSSEYEVLEEGYLTAPGEGSADSFGASSMPPISEGIITSPSGPPLLGQEVILDVPEDASGSDSSGKPSRRLRKKR